MIMGLIVFCLICWLGFKCGFFALKILYLICIGVPLAIVMLVFGALLCCTILLIPIGMAVFGGARAVLYPF